MDTATNLRAPGLRMLLMYIPGNASSCRYIHTYIYSAHDVCTYMFVLLYSCIYIYMILCIYRYMYVCVYIYIIIYLVDGFNPSKKYDLVSWDDEIPNWMENHKIPWFQMFQSTNQILYTILGQTLNTINGVEWNTPWWYIISGWYQI